ncbi:unnamed protein product [Closterium sp. NIES-65]|nr:unnamed protein product [Closterium sp. NIES-65]
MAVDWWTWHGTDHPELTTMACRAITQPVSASPCERNWAKFDAVHTARRNRLGAVKLRDLVYVTHNWQVVHNWHKAPEGLGVVKGNIEDPPTPAGYNTQLASLMCSSLCPIPSAPLPASSSQLDVLTEENEFLVDKLRMAEEDLKEKQARVQELEKQVAKMGEGLSLEARLLNKKEAVLKQREASLKEMKDKSKDVKEVEITTLRMELESQREEAAAAMEEARQASEEVRALRSLTARILLTPEEKEEVVLKRCWLARYWALASRHGVHAEIASSRSDHWQKYSPLPFEVVIDAGRKAREEPDGGEKEDKPATVGTESNIESMFQVEKALRDLAALKVEEGVLLAMAQHRRPALLKVHSAPSAAEEGPRMVESMDLSDEEVEDVRPERRGGGGREVQAELAGVLVAAGTRPQGVSFTLLLLSSLPLPSTRADLSDEEVEDVRPERRGGGGREVQAELAGVLVAAGTRPQGVSFTLLLLSSLPLPSTRADLSDEEVEDVRFKQNWLVYWWRRARGHKVSLSPSYYFLPSPCLLPVQT